MITLKKKQLQVICVFCCLYIYCPLSIFLYSFKTLFFSIISNKHKHSCTCNMVQIYNSLIYVSACVANIQIRNKLFASVKLLIIVFFRLDFRDRSDGNFGTNCACCEVLNISRQAKSLRQWRKYDRIELLPKSALDFVQKFTCTPGLYNCTCTPACSKGLEFSFHTKRKEGTKERWMIFWSFVS